LIGEACIPIWVVDSTDPLIDAPSSQRMLQRFGPVVDIANLTVQQAAEAMRPHRPDGILAFADRQLKTAALLAQELSLAFDTPEVIERTVDKPLQRAALREGGVPVPMWWTLPAGAPSDDVDRIVAEATFPLVLKPQRGTTSSYTYLAKDARSLLSILSDPENEVLAADYIVEEFIPGTSREIDSDVADFVSVESVVSSGVISHLAICGKFTLEPPFRGAGGFRSGRPTGGGDRGHPRRRHTIAARARDTHWLHAHGNHADSPRGARCRGQRSLGRQHSDIHQGKHRRIASALGGGDCPRSTHRATGTLPCDHITFRVHGQPPMWATRFVDIEGLEVVARMPGVEEAVLRQSLNTPVNWRNGAGYLIYLVTGRANDHREMLALRSRILSTIRTTFK
jgi:hypothetical protein